MIYAKWVDPSPVMNKCLPFYETESGDEKFLTKEDLRDIEEFERQKLMRVKQEPGT